MATLNELKKEKLTNLVGKTAVISAGLYDHTYKVLIKAVDGGEVTVQWEIGTVTDVDIWHISHINGITY